MRKECDIKQYYTGFETFVHMSSGIPRHLLVLMKKIYDWAVFFGEKPFEVNNVISQEAQVNGVKEAAEWFYRDAHHVGEHGLKIQRAIDRLGNLFRS